MKLKQLFMGLLMAVGLAACSSDTPADSSSDPNEIGQGENFISVSIEMPVSAGSRTTEGSFDDGTLQESKVSNIVFFFFDEAGNCIEVQKKDDPAFQNPPKPSTNPNITNYGTVEVRLKAGLKYDRIAVALNSPAADATSLKAAINTIDDLLDRSVDYASKVNADGSGQVMSNSVYFDMGGMADKPTEDKKVDVIKITEKNIYSSAERANIDKMIEDGDKEYVEIYVERVLSRIDVSKPEFDMTQYYISIDETGEKRTSVTLYDYANSSSRSVTIRPVVKGMVMNVCAPRTALIKPLHFDELGYGIGGDRDRDFKDFQWNDPLNKRSYWASTAFLDSRNMKYEKWNDAVGKGMDGFTEYIHPNTQAYEPTFENEGSSLNTKLMVVAELHAYEGEEDKGAVDLVMFGADYMTCGDFLTHIANLVNKDILGIDWNEVTFRTGDNVLDLTPEQRNDIKASVENAFGTGGGSCYGGSDFKLANASAADPVTKFGDQDWIAEVQLSESGSGKSISLTGLPSVDGLLSMVTNVIKQSMGNTIGRINSSDTNLLYWNSGRTYYYTNIRHQGFQGLTGAGNNFLYGVVRNHIYKITLQGIYGLGTPVIDPRRPIDPDRPNGDRPSYIKAKINILPWRVVTNNATIH